MLTPEQLSLREEAVSFVRSVPRQLILDMDVERIPFPRGYLGDVAARQFLCLRFPKEYGGRGLNWAAEVVALEEIATLPQLLGCLYSLVTIVGEAITLFGTEHQKRRFLQPMLAGRLVTAEALTEPRGGSDFFGATTVAARERDEYLLKGQKRFVVGADKARIPDGKGEPSPVRLEARTPIHVTGGFACWQAWRPAGPHLTVVLHQAEPLSEGILAAFQHNRG